MDDLISRQAAIEALHMHLMYRMGTDSNKKRLDEWINGLPSAQETHEERTETHACDCISRQAASNMLNNIPIRGMKEDDDNLHMLVSLAQVICAIEQLPSAQPEIIRCRECRHSEHWYRDKARCFLWHEEGIDVFEDGYCSYAERRTDDCKDNV